MHFLLQNGTDTIWYKAVSVCVRISHTRRKMNSRIYPSRYEERGTTHNTCDCLKLATHNFNIWDLLRQQKWCSKPPPFVMTMAIPMKQERSRELIHKRETRWKSQRDIAGGDGQERIRVEQSNQSLQRWIDCSADDGRWCSRKKRKKEREISFSFE